MQHLPNVDEQKWLIQAFQELVATRGADHLVSMPIVEPTRHFFPDPWAFSPRGLDRVVRRLLQYARLTDLEPEIATFAQVDSTGDAGENQHACYSTAGAFFGIENGKCYFAFNEHAPDESEYAAGVMCHEVAHAYRAVHGLVRSSQEEEELLTDVTSVYLGFGILAANVNHRIRTYGTEVGYYVTYTWSNQRVGYLTPQAFAYLLALQIVARDLRSGERSRLLKHLEPNQAAFTRTALDSLRSSSRSVPDLLKLPSKETWPPPVPLTDILKQLPGWKMSDEGRPVRKIVKARFGLYSALGFVAGIMLMLFTGKSVDIGTALWFPVLGIVAGSYWAFRNRRYLCSNVDCKGVIPRDASSCPKCNGPIIDPIENARS